MELIYFLSVIISIASAVLSIMLFIKLWRATNQINEMYIRYMFGQSTPPVFEKSEVQSSEKTTSQTHNTSVRRESSPDFPNGIPDSVRRFLTSLKKGDSVRLRGYGSCTYQGPWQGKYSFYLDNKKNPTPSEFLVEGDEPYLLIPAEKITNFLGN